MDKFLNADCLEVMKQYPDNYFDLAIVDPPYFSGPEKKEILRTENQSNRCKQTVWRNLRVANSKQRLF